jgi:hypothetical protein
MRYSYAWTIEEDVLLRALGTEAEGKLRDAYVSVPGANASLWGHEVGDNPFWGHEGGNKRAGTVAISLEEWGYGRLLLALVRGKVDERNMSVHPVPSGPFRGRLSIEDAMVIVVDTTASRFHPASVAALVVGAMGCFIFGLYLRAWLRERKALASEPPQDMIA